jgi:hypothetical protein
MIPLHRARNIRVFVMLSSSCYHRYHSLVLLLVEEAFRPPREELTRVSRPSRPATSGTIHWNFSSELRHKVSFVLPPTIASSSFECAHSDQVHTRPVAAIWHLKMSQMAKEPSARPNLAVFFGRKRVQI